jgi:hypothetical protein
VHDDDLVAGVEAVADDVELARGHTAAQLHDDERHYVVYSAFSRT